MRFANVFITLLFIIVFSYPAFGAWDIEQAWTQNIHDAHISRLTITWTEDASASGNETVNTKSIDGYVYMVVTNPGVPAPDAYDITMKDEDDHDIMEGTMTNRSATETETMIPSIGGSPAMRFVKGNLTINMINQDTDSATGKIILYIYRD